MLTRRSLLKLASAGIVVMLASTVYPLTEALRRPRITRYALTPPGWPKGQKLRLVALADFHACEPWMPADRIRSICEQANALEGDVVLLLGDYMSGMRLANAPVAPEAWAQALSVLKAPYGVHAVLGNHDWWEDTAAQAERLTDTVAHRALRSVGISAHSNTAVRLGKPDQPFWIAGLEDQWAYLTGYKATRGLDDLPGTLAQVTDDAPVILLAHEPDIFPQVPDRVSLTLSGHTHGGQINLFGWTPVVPSRYGSRYVAGHKVEDGRHIIVSRGLGVSTLPMRFLSPPEILVIDLGEA